MKFPNNLYVLRNNKGLQQKEVAEAIGVVQSEYSKMERGDRKLGIHLDKLLKFFGVDQDTILNNFNANSLSELSLKAPLVSMLLSSLISPKIIAAINGKSSTQ